MSPKGGGGPGGTGGGRPEDPKGPRRGIGAGGARSAASRLPAVRIALAHDLVRAGRILDRRGGVTAARGGPSAGGAAAGTWGTPRRGPAGGPHRPVFPGMWGTVTGP